MALAVTPCSSTGPVDTCSKLVTAIHMGKPTSCLAPTAGLNRTTGTGGTNRARTAAAISSQPCRSALRIAGRLDPAEAMRPEYGFLPAAHRERARIAKPGTMFVSQPEIPVPLVAEFPFPAWATRPCDASHCASSGRRSVR